MSQRRPTVHLICGVAGAGKSTYARQLASERSAVWFGLDAWMLHLHGLHFDEDAYATLADHCKELIWTVAQRVLAVGHDVVLDWNSWSAERRAEWRRRVEAVGAGVLLHYIDVPVEMAIQRAEARGRSNDRSSHRLTPADVRQNAGIFEPPTPAEGIPIVRVTS